MGGEDGEKRKQVGRRNIERREAAEWHTNEGVGGVVRPFIM